MKVGDYLMQRAFVKHRLGRYDAAVMDYTYAISQLKTEGKPLFDAYCNRGNCFRLLNRIEESIEDLEVASSMNLNNAACRVRIQQIHHKACSNSTRKLNTSVT